MFFLFFTKPFLSIFIIKFQKSRQIADKMNEKNTLRCELIDKNGNKIEN